MELTDEEIRHLIRICKSIGECEVGNIKKQAIWQVCYELEKRLESE